MPPDIYLDLVAVRLKGPESNPTLSATESHRCRAQPIPPNPRHIGPRCGDRSARNDFSRPSSVVLHDPRRCDALTGPACEFPPPSPLRWSRWPARSASTCPRAARWAEQRAPSVEVLGLVVGLGSVGGTADRPNRCASGSGRGGRALDAVGPGVDALLEATPMSSRRCDFLRSVPLPDRAERHRLVVFKRPRRAVRERPRPFRSTVARHGPRCLDRRRPRAATADRAPGRRRNVPAPGAEVGRPSERRRSDAPEG